MSYTVKELRGLATILDCVVRQLYNVELEEIQIMSANDRLIIASNEFTHTNSIFSELKKNKIGAWNFERLMYLAYITEKTIRKTPYLLSKFQSTLNIYITYGGSPITWAQSYRIKHMSEALEMEKLLKVVLLRRMRSLDYFGDRYTENTYKKTVYSYLGIDLNKAFNAHVDFILKVMGVKTTVTLKDLKLRESAPAGATVIPIKHWKNSSTAKNVLIDSGDRIFFYNCDNYPHKAGPKIHAEQHLLTLLIDIARQTDTGYRANIGGKKQACRVCDPVMLKFGNAYSEAYDTEFNEPEDGVGSVGSGAGSMLNFSEDHAGDNGKPKFKKFIEYWQLPNGSIWHNLKPIFD